MNNYIVVDGYQYKTMHGEWGPIVFRPASVRRLLMGGIDVTYGPDVYKEHDGILMVPSKAVAPWGDIDNLRATFEKRESVTFVDHQDNEYTVHLVGESLEVSMTPDWDSQYNIFYVRVRLVHE